DSATYVSTVPSLNAISDPLYPYFHVNIPDQYRVDVWLQEFQQAEKTGNLPSLEIIQLPDDHTGGAPSGSAQVADNDLALGRVVDTISHSRFWKNSAIFAEEDDTQAGADHLSGHRGPLWIASPYAKRGVVNSDYYTQVNVDKTIEQILGLQPMNQMDRAAVPMFDAFTNTPNYAPYDTVPNQIPLTAGVAGFAPTTAQAAPQALQPTVDAWANWDATVAQPSLDGPYATPDSTNAALLNRYDWYTATHWSKPYPGDTKILAPDQVPGRNLPTSLSGGD
ncbi:MAG: phosphoesterase, partial [Mycobacterium sp.]|nr:phosphoesterase [Mycobacterium sp.]